jgi:hypothetical protein
VTILFNLEPGFFKRQITAIKLLHYALEVWDVNRDEVGAYHDAWVFLRVFYLLVPTVTFNLLKSEAFFGVCVEDLSNEVTALFTDEFRNRVISIKNFLV